MYNCSSNPKVSTYADTHTAQRAKTYILKNLETLDVRLLGAENLMRNIVAL
jgi:hypothetical protein